MRLPRLQSFYSDLVDIEADDVVADSNRAHGERETDVSLTDDDAFTEGDHVHLSEVASDVLCTCVRPGDGGMPTRELFSGFLWQRRSQSRSKRPCAADDRGGCEVRVRRRLPHRGPSGRHRCDRGVGVVVASAWPKVAF